MKALGVVLIILATILILVKVTEKKIIGVTKITKKTELFPEVTERPITETSETTVAQIPVEALLSGYKPLEITLQTTPRNDSNVVFSNASGVTTASPYVNLFITAYNPSPVVVKQDFSVEFGHWKKSFVVELQPNETKRIALVGIAYDQRGLHPIRVNGEVLGHLWIAGAFEGTASVTGAGANPPKYSAYWFYQRYFVKSGFAGSWWEGVKKGDYVIQWSTGKVGTKYAGD
jgi:hypothetical protein